MLVHDNNNKLLHGDNVEIAKIIYENLAAHPNLRDDELAEWASHLMKTPVSTRRIARIRKETEAWRRHRAAEPPVDFSQWPDWLRRPDNTAYRS